MAARKRLDEIYAAYGEPDADFDKLAEEQAKLEAVLFAQGDDLEQQLEIAADALRLPPWDAKIGPLSGGEKRRVALCRLLLSKPDMLLLDEPTNHLDAESVEWLEQFLQRFPGTVVAVTHDRYFLDNAAEWILELDRGRGIPWKGNYSSWLDQKQARLAQEEATESARQKALKRELAWVRSGTKAQQSKSKSRLARFEELSSYEYQRRNETQEIFIPVAERLGDQVIEFTGVRKAYGDRLLDGRRQLPHPAGRDRRHHRAERRGQDDAVPHDRGQGTARRRHDLDRLDREARGGRSDARVARRRRRRCSTTSPAGATCSRSAGSRCRRARISAASTSRAAISRSRSARCRAASAGGCTSPRRCSKAATCCCWTSRPTTSTSRRCARSRTRSDEFAGTVLVISHDRWFLDRIATHIIAFEGDSSVYFFEGNYQEYEANKKARLGEEAARPHRLRYRPLTLP